MNNHVSWVFELSVTEGQLSNLKSLMKELVAATKDSEPGTLCYEWSLNPENDLCHIYERYVDSPAAKAHLGTFLDKYAARLMETGTPTRFDVYGAPSDEVVNVLNGLGAKYMSPIGGFARI